MFRTTVWTLVREAGKGRETAAGDLVARYRPAVVAFARGRGLDPTTAEDMAQEVLLRLFDGGVLAAADPAKGRFRNLVAAVTRNVIGRHLEGAHARKRGGGQAPLALDPDELARETPDPEFDREWAANLVGTALARLARENPDYHQAIRASLLDERSRAEVGAALGRSEDSVRNLVARGKARLAQILRDEVARYVASGKELEDELRWIAGHLQKPSP